jgi:ribosome-binding factor A
MSRRTHRSGARSSRALGSIPDPGPGRHRPHRLEYILLEQLQSLIRDEAADPALEGVRLVSMRLSIDGGHARVAYAVESTAPCDLAQTERSSREALGRATAFLRARLADLLGLKRLPRLTFTWVGVQEPAVSSDPSEGGEPWLA